MPCAQMRAGRSRQALKATPHRFTLGSALRARWGEAGRRKVIGRTWGRLCDELLGHYDEVIAARRGAVTSLDIKTK